jgi:hypothetical protein
MNREPHFQIIIRRAERRARRAGTEIYDTGTADLARARGTLTQLWEEERERLAGLGPAMAANVISTHADEDHASTSLVHPAKGMLNHTTFELEAPGAIEAVI